MSEVRWKGRFQSARGAATARRHWLTAITSIDAPARTLTVVMASD